jgi:hypothetical protein
MCSLHTNIERYSYDDFRFSFDATGYFTHNEHSGREAVSRALNLKENSQPKAAVRGHSDSGARSLSFSKSGCLFIQLL